MARKLTSERAQKLLREVEKEREFHSYSGNRIRSVEDLHDILIKMDEREFMFHRNNSKNDFYNWVKNVVEDIKLANDIARAKTKQTTVKRVDERIRILKELMK